MEEFPYYGLSWFFYLLVAAIFLLVSSWKTRDWSSWSRIPLLTFLAALALTPGVTVSGESWWSPAAIIMILELDQKGLIGSLPILLSILAVWILLITATVLIRWKLLKKPQPLTEPDEDVDDIPGQPELIDPSE